MSTFKVIVTEEDPDVPGTGVFTASGLGNMGGIGIGILISVAVVAAVVVTAVIRRRRIYGYNSRKGGFKISNKTKKIGGLFSILLIASALVVPLAVGGKNAEQVFADEGETDLAITVDNVTLNVEVKSNGGASVAYSNQYIYIDSATTGGYTLAMYASSANLLPAGASTTPIPGLSGSGAMALANDTWGVALTNPGGDTSSAVWQAVPTTKETALLLKDTSSATAAGDNTEIFYGVKLTNATMADTYSTTINYVATAKVTTP